MYIILLYILYVHYVILLYMSCVYYIMYIIFNYYSIDTIEIEITGKIIYFPRMENEFSAVFTLTNLRRRKIPESLFRSVEQTAKRRRSPIDKKKKKEPCLASDDHRLGFAQVDRPIRSSFTFPLRVAATV